MEGLMFDIEKTLVVSTGNISKATADLLESGKLKSLIVDSYMYGWRIYTGTDDAEDIPEDLSALINFAKNLDCKWLKLDQDGSKLDKFPEYDW